MDAWIAQTWQCLPIGTMPMWKQNAAQQALEIKSRVMRYWDTAVGLGGRPRPFIGGPDFGFSVLGAYLRNRDEGLYQQAMTRIGKPLTLLTPTTVSLFTDLPDLADQLQALADVLLVEAPAMQPIAAPPRPIASVKRPRAGSDPARWRSEDKLELLRWLVKNPEARPRKSIAAIITKNRHIETATLLRYLTDLKLAGWLSESAQGTCLSNTGRRGATKTLKRL